MCQESSPRRNQLEVLVLGFAFELFPILIQPKYQLKQSNMLRQSRRAASVVGCTDIYELEYGCECYEYETWRAIDVGSNSECRESVNQVVEVLS